MNKNATTVDRFTTVRYVKNVLRLSETSYYRVFKSTNYSMFKEREGNRNGLQDRRVKNFIKKIKADRFYPVLGLIFIDRKGIIIDGHHRFEALKRQAKPIFFMVIEDMTLPEISDFNTNKVNPAWKNKDNFSSAKTLGYDVATTLDTIRLEMLAKYSSMGIKEIEVDYGGLYAILVQSPKYFGNGVNTVTLDMLNNNSLVERAKSDEYYHQVDAYIKLKYMLDIHKKYKACKAIMECTFPENKKAVNFNIDYFLENHKTNKFRAISDRDGTAEFVHEAIRIHNIKLPKYKKAIRL